MKAVYYTAAELAARGSGDIPPELVSSTHLIYSSPATLAFNSPGAEGYGVKRAGLAVPESVMLIVSPGCCGRNTSAISRMPGYEDRFFYLTMDETDLVTGRHLKRIPGAVEEVCKGLAERGKAPRVVMICITCVDALLGTDMERVCRKAQERVPGVRVQPCYMYALTREGRKPPMVHVRQSIYELLEPRKKKPSSVNLLGFFSPLAGTPGFFDSPGARGGSGMEDSSGLFATHGSFSPSNGRSRFGKEAGSELFAILSQAGVRRIRQIGACRDYEAFQEMAEANFNLVLNPEARPAAYDLQKRLGIPFIELTRFYQIDRIKAQYAALGRALQTEFDDQKWKAQAEEAVAAFREAFPDAVFSVGEGMNGNPFELACALLRGGFAVKEIFGTVGADSFVWLRIIAALSPDTRVYSNLHPSMLHDLADEEESADRIRRRITIGRDAGFCRPKFPNVQWISDIQPYGYGAVTDLFRALKQAMEEGSRESYSPDISLGKKDISGMVSATDEAAKKAARGLRQFSGLADGGTAAPVGGFRDRGLRQFSGLADGGTAAPVGGSRIRGFRQFTTPFAPDQSGAVSVLYEMGGICVICDAGGCTGNICGFDEPRWFEKKSAVFSAGLRDMDAILGRDDRLVEKLAQAAREVPAAFAAIIGTPVPAVIGTDYRALCRMAEKKTGLPVIGISTDGMEYYDRGIEKTYLALLDTFCKKEAEERQVSSAASCGGAACRFTRQKRACKERNKEPGHAEFESAQGKDPAPEIGVWGFTPLDFAGLPPVLPEDFQENGWGKVLCCGKGSEAAEITGCGKLKKNLVVSPAGAAAAKWLEKKYGTPWEFFLPNEEALFDAVLGKMAESGQTGESGKISESGKVSESGKIGESGQTPGKVLILHQQVLADRLRRRFLEQGIAAETAGFFMMLPELTRPEDTLLREEADLRALVIERSYDFVIADRALQPLLYGLPARFIHLPHFAVSGQAQG